LLAADRPTRHAERIAPPADGVFAKLNGLAVVLLHYYPDPVMWKAIAAARLLVVPRERLTLLSGTLVFRGKEVGSARPRKRHI